jgi:hypothetical protein
VAANEATPIARAPNEAISRVALLILQGGQTWTWNARNEATAARFVPTVF